MSSAAKDMFRTQETDPLVLPALLSESSPHPQRDSVSPAFAKELTLGSGVRDLA